MSDAAVQHFDIGRVMSQTGNLISRNFVPFGVLALLLSGIPYVLALQIQPALIDPGNPTGTFFSVFLVTLFLTVVPAFVLQGALTRASIDDLGGRGVSIPSALQAGLAYILPLLGLAIVVGLGIMVGLVLLIVPGVILAICWSVSSPVVVVEKAGVFQAMQRSLALTKNHRWAIFGIMVIYAIVVWVISIVVLLLVQGTLMPAPAQAMQPPSIIASIVFAILQTFVALLSTVGIAAIYFELRRVKEGVDVTQLAEVFA